MGGTAAGGRGRVPGVLRPPYLTLDPDRANVPAPDGFPLHYPLLLAHIAFGTVALLTCGFQVWPRFRERHRKAHRIMGRLYVFAGVLPAGVLAVVVGAVSPFGPVAAVANVLGGLLWLGVTVAGMRMAVRRRHREHRRWMIRSFALTTSIVAARFWGVLAALTLFANADFDTDDLGAPHVQGVAGLAAWLGLTVNLLVAQWWLDRAPARGGAPSTAGQVQDRRRSARI